MGMLHTHTRPDREKYLKIMKANIDPKAYANFEVRKTGGDTFGLDFDHESIMMYKALDSFAIGPDYNIKVRAQSDSAKDYQIALERFKKLGTYQNLSKGDIATVAAMYGKRPNCPKVTNQQVISTNGATNPGTLTYPTNGATNPGTLTYRTTAGTYPTQLTYPTTGGTYQYYWQPASASLRR
jgi:type II secretory pathway pseudopilin PulG